MFIIFPWWLLGVLLWIAIIFFALMILPGPIIAFIVGMCIAGIIGAAVEKSRENR